MKKIFKQIFILNTPTHCRPGYVRLGKKRTLIFYAFEVYKYFPLEDEMTTYVAFYPDSGAYRLYNGGMNLDIEYSKFDNLIKSYKER